MVLLPARWRLRSSSGPCRGPLARCASCPAGKQPRSGPAGHDPDRVNFDGARDFAVRDARNECDHGASYHVFLFDAKRGRLVENAAFSALSQEWCGLFEVDPVHEQLRTHRQLGCAPEEPCWHGYARWQVVGGVPVQVNRRTVQRVPGERDGEWVMVEREERFVDGRWMLMPRRLVEE